MAKQLRRALGIASVVLAVGFFVAGAMLLGIRPTTADTDDIDSAVRESINLPAPLRLATPVPMPDASLAVSVERARPILADVSGVGEVIAAVESGNADALIALADATSSSCRDYYGRDWEEMCQTSAGADEVLSLVGFDSGIEGARRPAPVLRDLIAEVMASADLVLDVVTRDDREPAGAGATYYLTFSIPPPGIVGDRRTGGLGLIVQAGAERPIQSIVFLSAESGSVVWLQQLSPEHQLLVAPASLDGRPNLNDNIRLPRGYPGYPDGYPPQR